MISIVTYGCSTAAGEGVENLWNGVSRGQDFSQPVEGGLRACLWNRVADESSEERILRHLGHAWRESAKGFAAEKYTRIGVIFASTKGYVDDVIWAQDSDLSQDFLRPILMEFSRRHFDDFAKQIHTSIVISNACSSSLSAIWLAQRWLNENHVQAVIILAADTVGPFVLKGFQALQALTSTASRPFSATRDGLQLGDGAAVIVLTSERNSQIRLCSAGIDTEGFAVTRPSPMGESLIRAMSGFEPPDFIIAHGTATHLNDFTEDIAFSKAFGTKPAITGSKWSVGHTLGASGAVDLILACEALQRGKTFRLGNTDSIDPKFHSRYLTKFSELDFAPRRVLISSAGFGGVHAAGLVALA